MLASFQLLAVSNAVIKSFKLLKVLPETENDHAKVYISTTDMNESLTTLKLWITLVLFHIYSMSIEKYVYWVPGYSYVKSFFVLLTLFPQLKLVNFFYDEVIVLAYSYAQYKIEEFAISSPHDFLHKFLLLSILIMFPHVVDIEIPGVTQMDSEIEIEDCASDDEDELETAILLQSNRKSMIPSSVSAVKDIQNSHKTTHGLSNSDDQNMSPNLHHISLLTSVDEDPSPSQLAPNGSAPNGLAPCRRRSISVSKRISDSQSRLSQLSPYLQRLQSQFRVTSTSTSHPAEAHSATTATSLTGVSSAPMGISVLAPHSPVPADNTVSQSSNDSDNPARTVTLNRSFTQDSTVDSMVETLAVASIETQDEAETSMLDQSSIIMDQSNRSLFVSNTSPQFLRRLTKSAVTPGARRPSGAATLSRNLFGDFMRSMTSTTAKMRTPATGANNRPTSRVPSQASTTVKATVNVSGGASVNANTSVSATANANVNANMNSSTRSGSNMRRAAIQEQESSLSKPPFASSSSLSSSSSASIPPAKPPRVQSASRVRENSLSKQPNDPTANTSTHTSSTDTTVNTGRSSSRNMRSSPTTSPNTGQTLLNGSTKGNTVNSGNTISSRKKWQ